MVSAGELGDELRRVARDLPLGWLAKAVAHLEDAQQRLTLALDGSYQWEAMEVEAAAMTSQSSNRIVIRLEVDWNAGPFWVSVDGEPADSYDVDEVGEFVSLSEGLLRAISEWDQRFQKRMNWDDPNASNFFTPDEQAAFDAEGRALAHRIKSEVPAEVEVRYKPFGGAPGEVIPTDARR